MSANASLLGNFEIVATTVIALFIFKEAVSKRLWAAIVLISLSSILLSFERMDSFNFSYGSLFVLAATVCWGFENNCTRNISSKSTYEIVVLKDNGYNCIFFSLICTEIFGESLDKPVIHTVLPGAQSVLEIDALLEYYKKSEKEFDYSFIGAFAPP